MPGLPRLNADQSAVVAALEGDVVVVAGAGSGKTRVLAERFVERVLLDETRGAEGGPMAGTLLITFTDKAAGEVAERVRRVLLARERPDLARSVDRAWISTIHGFCHRIVRRHALDLGIDPGFVVLDETEAGIMRHEAFESAGVTAMRCDAAIADLLGAHGVSAVRAAVLSGLEKVRAMGAAVSEMRIPEAPDLRAECVAGLADLERAVEEYRGLRRTATVDKNLAAATGTLARLARAVAEHPGSELAAEILCVTGGVKLSAQGDDEMKALTHTLREAIASVRMAATRSIAAGHAAAYARLLTMYSDQMESAKRARNALDFEDLQLLAARLFEERVDVLERYGGQFRAVMVDEFQDTNELQMRVIGPLAHGRLCVVGDERQSIYGFRYAAVEVFVEAKRRLESAADGCLHTLNTNYRTHASLLATIDALFGSHALFGEGFLRLEAGREEPEGVAWPADDDRTEVLLVDTKGWHDLSWREAEARALAGRLGRMVREGAARQGDIVVLLRAMTTAPVYARALEAEGLRVFADAGGFFATTEVADLRALLRVVADSMDSEAVVGLLAGGLGGVSDDALHLLSVAAGPYGNLWAALGQAEGAGLTGDDLDRARSIHETVEGLRHEQGRLPLADAILNGCGALAGAGGCFSRHGAWANVRKAARLASAFEKVVPADIGAFLGYLEDREAHAKRERSAGVAVEGADAVRIMSVHAAKGLEFPVVAVADLGHNEVRETDRILLVRQDASPTVAVRLPVSFGDAPAPPEFERARDERARAELDEAKRVFYVACTRAKDALILSGASDLAKPPPERLAIGWVRAGVGDAVLEGGAPALPGTAVTVVTADDEERLSAAPAAPAANRRDDPDVSGLATAASAAAVQGIPVATREHSYTSLRQYRACPYRYYAEHVLGLRPVRSREPDSETPGAAGASGSGAPRAFGAVIHAGLQLIAEEGSVDAARLDALARRHALPAGSRDRLALAMEAAERSDVVRRARAAAARGEVPFAVSLEGGLLVGTMDLFAETDGAALIVDFKTGASVLTAARAAERFRGQAECYAIAALAGGAKSVEAVFVEVERGGRETRFTFDGSDEARLRASVDDTMARVAASRFERRADWDPHVCGECPAQGSLCRIRRPRRSAV